MYVLPAFFMFSPTKYIKRKVTNSGAQAFFILGYPWNLQTANFNIIKIINIILRFLFFKLPSVLSGL